MHKIIQKWLGKLNIFTVFLVSVLLIGGVGTATYVLASATSQFSQIIGVGTLSVDFVDGSGNSVVSPSVTMGGLSFSFGTQDATGQLATATEKIRTSNPTQTKEWTVVIAATPADTWHNGGSSKHFDFNDAGGYIDDGATTDDDSYGGQMTINPTTGTITGVDGCTTTGVTKGSSASFIEGTTDSITIMEADGTASAECRWEFVGAASNVTQKIPAKQSADTYTIDLTLTIS